MKSEMELAARHHVRNLPVVIKESVEESGVSLRDIDVIGVTNRPGLIGALLTGLSFAKGLSYTLQIPLIGINHLEAHFMAALIENNVTFPFVALVVSGGHTTLFYVKKPMEYKILGETRDDAAGEAFDKVSKLLGLGYPGGAIIDKLAKKGDPDKYNFPRGMINSKDYDFSFLQEHLSVFHFGLIVLSMNMYQSQCLAKKIQLLNCVLLTISKCLVTSHAGRSGKV
jgi:N6-L-threonylcarbamoyladenine synthase